MLIVLALLYKIIKILVNVIGVDLTREYFHLIIIEFTKRVKSGGFHF